jgi:hypothetical protein
LEDHINGRDFEGVNDARISDAEQDVVAPKPKKARAAPKTKAAPKVTAKKSNEEEMVEIEQTPAVARSNHAPVRGKNNTSKVANKSTTASKAKHGQQANTAIGDSQSVLGETEQESESAMNEPLVQGNKPVRAPSKTRQEPAYRRRAGSASDTERGDPNLRRKLGDITRIVIHEAIANMERLRKQCDATMQASNALVVSLKKELASQAPQAQEARKLMKQMQSQEEEVNKLRQTATELGNALSAAQNEVKSLQAKLAAARASSVEVATAKVPGSAIKPKAQRALMPGCADTEDAVRMAQMKQDLYSDLTGLIIRSVRKTEEGDTYDCIQTGRNGSMWNVCHVNILLIMILALHFKLYVDQEDARSASFEKTEFLYTPLLDEDRDKVMIELMPSYLREDITFARENAAKFYARVVDTLTKR